MKSKKYCLDSSIFIKLLTKEYDSKHADRLMRYLVKRKAIFTEPNLLNIEVYSVLRRKTFQRQISNIIANKALQLFNQLDTQIIYEDKKLLLSAFKLSQQLTQPVIYDSIYLAIAKQSKASFITADKKFLTKAKTKYQKSFLLRDFIEQKD